MSHVEGLLLMRVNPRIFSDAIKGLSEDQKKWVMDTGLGSLLNFSMEEKYPPRLGNYLVSSFDQLTSTMSVGGININITEEDVNKVLGLPMGPNTVDFENNNVVRDIWSSQFPSVPIWKVSDNMVKNSIIASPFADVNFKYNFLVLMSNTIINGSTTPYVKSKMVDFAGNVDKCSDYNWCQYLLTCLQEASILLTNGPRRGFYSGSIAFLMYFYLDHVVRDQNTVNESIPTFIQWKDSDIAKQERDHEVMALGNVNNVAHNGNNVAVEDVD